MGKKQEDLVAAEAAAGIKGIDISALMKSEHVVEVPFDEAMGAYVSIKYLTRDEILALRKKATKISFKDHQKVEEVDPVKADLLLCDAAVRGFRGFVLGDKAFDYSPDNARVLMGWTRFSRFVNQVCDDLEALNRAELEAEGKK